MPDPSPEDAAAEKARPPAARDGWRDATWAAARAARPYLISARGFRACITAIEPRGEAYHRALNVIERRAVELRMSPAKGAEGREPQDLPNAADIDPWEQDTSEIEGQSRVLALCPTCEGAGGATCAACQGHGALGCSRCGGLGRTRTDNVQRTCTECIGQGRLACGSCERGLLPCRTCERSGRVVAWLQVERKVFQTVTVHAHGSGADAHPGLREPADFDAGKAAWPNPLARDSGVIPPTAAIPKELLPLLDRRTDRLRSTRLQTFGAVVHRILYATPLGGGMVEMSGTPPAVLDSTEWRPLEVRRLLLLATFAVGAFVAFMIKRRYESRALWFSSHGHGMAVFGAALGSALLATIVLGGALLPAKGRSFSRLWIPFVLLCGATAGSVSTFRMDPPSAVRAKDSLTAGNMDDARAEADAMIALGRDEAAARWILDAVHTRDVERAPDLQSALTLYRTGFRDDRLRGEALGSVRGKAATEIARLSVDRNTLGLFALGSSLADLDPELASRARTTAARFRVDECVQNHEPDCAFHAEELDKSTRDFLTFRLAAARFERAVEDGDFELAWASRERVVDAGAPALEVDRLDAIALPALETKTAEARRALTNATSLASRREALLAAIKTAKSVAKFAGHEPSPPTSFFEAQLAALDRSLDLSKR